MGTAARLTIGAEPMQPIDQFALPKHSATPIDAGDSRRLLPIPEDLLLGPSSAAACRREWRATNWLDRAAADNQKKPGVITPGLSVIWEGLDQSRTCTTV
tara:strand:- start:47 stop:346 length:300 start_codon:yes stop_codon:yes gene_type:complete